MRKARSPLEDREYSGEAAPETVAVGDVVGEGWESGTIPRTLPGNGGAWNMSEGKGHASGNFPENLPSNGGAGDPSWGKVRIPGIFQGMEPETVALGIRSRARSGIQGIFQGLCPLSKCHCSADALLGRGTYDW